MIQKYGRKFFLCLVAFIVWTLLFVFKFLEQTSYVNLCLGTIVAYIAGNVSQKMVSTKDSSESP
jgi:multisubunit Na+/H+ antiporter MnhE subunit